MFPRPPVSRGVSTVGDRWHPGGEGVGAPHHAPSGSPSPSPSSPSLSSLGAISVLDADQNDTAFVCATKACLEKMDERKVYLGEFYGLYLEHGDKNIRLEIVAC